MSKTSGPDRCSTSESAAVEAAATLELLRESARSSSYPFTTTLSEAQHLESFEAWKKVAAAKAYLIFGSLRWDAAISAEMKEMAADLILGFTWWAACKDLTPDQQLEALSVNRTAMLAHASALVERAIMARWKRIIADWKRGALSRASFYPTDLDLS